MLNLKHDTKESESVNRSVVFHSYATPGTVARQAPLSMESSRQEYWSGLPFPFPGDLPDSGIEPGSHVLQADSLQSEPPGKSSYLFPQIRVFGFFFEDSTSACSGLSHI